MEEYNVKIRSIKKLTHDVLQINVDKPNGYTFLPGQATEVAVNKEGWKDERRPFTFTSLPADDYLQFTIKTYTSHNGVTNQLLQSTVDDELIIHDVWGTISYKGEGVFIAGGTGITPFIAIFKDLHARNQLAHNRLIFANKTKADIILEEAFQKMLGDCFINILSDEVTSEYAHGHINATFLKQHISNAQQKFYICGPEPMMDAVEQQLATLQVNKEDIIKEQF